MFALFKQLSYISSDDLEPALYSSIQLGGIAKAVVAEDAQDTTTP